MLGSGGREHALAWKLTQSPKCNKLFAAPGNPGIAEHAVLASLNLEDHDGIIGFCKENSVGLVVVGPEAPLVDGLADKLQREKIPVFGPSKAAAQLEGSKGFTKELCQRASIPTAGYVRATSLSQAVAALGDFEPPYVLKADGLAAGKGVVISENKKAAEKALREMFGGAFGEAGAEVIIEEFMEGEEASFFAITDGQSILPFGTAQDHKRVGDGDTGPNTGGMGAYSPAPVLTKEIQRKVLSEIIEPTVRKMAEEGMPYSGVLYAGLMLTESGPKLIEYNCRFGDPECQVLMFRLRSDLATIMLACAKGELGKTSCEFASETAITVVMAANGYPGLYSKGDPIDLKPMETARAKVFHAGTKISDGALVTNGGRVLNVTALGENVTEAQKASYRAIDNINFPTGFYRKDIGWREIKREAEK